MEIQDTSILVEEQLVVETSCYPKMEIMVDIATRHQVSAVIFVQEQAAARILALHTILGHIVTALENAPFVVVMVL